MGDETTKIFLNSKGSREGIDSDLADFRGYIEGKAPKGKFTERQIERKIASANGTANYNVNCNHTLSTHLFQCFTKAIGDVPRPSHSVNPVILFEKLKCKIIRLIPLQQFDFHK